MKNKMHSIIFGFVFSVLFFSSCSFGFEPSWKEKEKAIISFQFSTLDSITRAADGSRAIIQGDGFLYVRTLGGPKGDKGPLYGPYAIKAGSSFETNDIPAGTYSKGIAVLYSAIELGSLEATMKLPDDQFLTAIYEAAFTDVLSGVASGVISDPKTIKAGQKNSLELTLIPIVNSASTVNFELVKKYTVTPATTGGSVQKFIRLDNVTSGVPTGASITDLVCTASGTGTVSFITLYDSAGALMPTTASTTEPGTYTASYTSGATFYLYIECSGGAVDLAFDAYSLYEGYVYYVSDEGGGDGSLPSSPMTFDDAFVAIAANASNGDGRMNWIVLTENITTSDEEGYQLSDSRNVTITSNDSASYTITLGVNIAEGSFLDVGADTTLTLMDVTISGDSDPNSLFYAVNGLVMVESNGVFNMLSGSKLMNNVVSSSGGGVKVEGGTFTMSEGEISYCTSSEGSGGGVYVYGGTFTMTGGEISNCSGGGVFVESYEGSNGTFAMTGGKISSCSNDEGNGGGVYVSSGSFLMSGGTISQNKTFSGYYGNGGGVYIASSMSGGMISQNEANYGGGVYIDSGSMAFGGNATITGNTATISGGGVYVASGYFSMSGGEISNCCSNYSGSGDYGYGGGGGVYVASGSFSMSGGTISQNKALSDELGYGGGVYVASGSFSMSGGTISQNSADYGGGGVFVYGGTFTMSGGEISYCTIASGSGGGVHVYGGTFTMSGGEISHCTIASGSGAGGGVYVDSTFTMSGSSMIFQNEACYGGGVGINSGTMAFNDAAAIVGNTAEMVGGGLYLGSDLTDFSLESGTQSITDNIINYETDMGAGVYIQISDNAVTVYNILFNSSCVSNNFFNTSSPSGDGNLYRVQ